VVAIVLLMWPGSISSLLLSGAVDWHNSASLEPANINLAGNPNAQFEGPNSCILYKNSHFERQTRGFQAAGFVSIMWTNNDSGDQLSCRRVVNSDLPIGSKLFNATLPYIKINETY